jgi:hypothetical protein
MLTSPAIRQDALWQVPEVWAHCTKSRVAFDTETPQRAAPARTLPRPLSSFTLSCCEYMHICGIIPPMKRITLFITEQQIAAIQAMAATSGLKFAEILRRMIDESLARQQERKR